MIEANQTPDLTPLQAPTASAWSIRRGLARIGRSIEGLAGWLADRIDDLGHWLSNLVRLLPVRVARVVVTFVTGIVACATLLPSALRVRRSEGASYVRSWWRARSRQGAVRLVQLALEVLDVFGAPEMFAFVWRMITRCTPLTGHEIEAATQVLGPRAIRYHEVRVADGGMLKWVFRVNGNRAFATFHTINLTATGGHTRQNLPIVVHELIHVYQYEKAGSRYMAEALLAQRAEGYGYGGTEGLRRSLDQGRRLRNFNREQQAQIAEDYFRSGIRDTVRFAGDSAYDTFIDELRNGRI